MQNLIPSDFSEFERIRHKPTRERSLATRALLRGALSDFVGDVKETEWTFERDANGKPRLIKGPSNIHFSCSHTAWQSVVAVSDRPVGIDIECGEIAADDAFLEEYFSRKERAAIASKPIKDRGVACARLWTLKEAVSKLIGTGLAFPFSELEFESEEDRLSQGISSGISTSELLLTTWSLPNPAHPLTVALALQR